jgi:hypothetical protein
LHASGASTKSGSKVAKKTLSFIVTSRFLLTLVSHAATFKR